MSATIEVRGECASRTLGHEAADTMEVVGLRGRSLTLKPSPVVVIIMIVPAGHYDEMKGRARNLG
jgi:hypothetical protein